MEFNSVIGHVTCIEQLIGLKKDPTFEQLALSRVRMLIALQVEMTRNNMRENMNDVHLLLHHNIFIYQPMCYEGK